MSLKRGNTLTRKEGHKSTLTQILAIQLLLIITDK